MGSSVDVSCSLFVENPDHCVYRSEDSFTQYFSEMPWLAVPYTDEARRSRLNRLYGIQGVYRAVCAFVCVLVY